VAEPNQGEIWMFGFGKPNRTRPVVVITRQEIIHSLANVTVAPITRTIRGLPNEVAVGPDVGLKTHSAINLDNVTTVPKSGLKQFIGTLPRPALDAVCRGLCFTFGCGPYSAR
jgi:mRNA interferase MazF